MVAKRPGISGRMIAWLLFLAAGAYVLVRGVVRAVEPYGSGDFAYGYASSRVWLDGLNPYRTGDLVAEHLASGGSLIDVAEGLSVNVHPPPALPMFLAVSLQPWNEARALVLVVNMVLTFAIIVGLVRFLGWRLTAPRSLLMGAFVIALAPIHSAFASGQSGIFVTAALVWATALESRRPGASGLLLGLATALKFTLGLPFVAWAVVRRRFTIATVAIAVIAVLTTVAVVRMELVGVPWVHGWTDNLAVGFGPEGINSADPEARGGPSMVNLQYPLAMLLGGEGLANLATFAFVAAAALMTIILVRDGGRPETLLGMSLVAALTLLVTYHRYYDAVLLAFPVAWGIWAVTAGRLWLGGAVLFLCADFLVPAQTALAKFAGALPSWMTDNVLWDAVVLAQHSWALTVLVVVLLIGAATGRRSERLVRAELASRPLA